MGRLRMLTGAIEQVGAVDRCWERRSCNNCLCGPDHLLVLKVILARESLWPRRSNRPEDDKSVLSLGPLSWPRAVVLTVPHPARSLALLPGGCLPPVCGWRKEGAGQPWPAKLANPVLRPSMRCDRWDCRLAVLGLS